MRRLGESPSESLTRPLRGVRGPPPARRCGGTAFGAAARRIAVGRHRSLRSQRGPRGGRVDRAQRSGASLNTATRGKPLRRGAENLRGPAGDRRLSAAAPFAGTPQGRASQALATALLRTGVQGPDPEAKRSGARGRVGTGNGCGNGTGNGVAWVTYIHIFHYPHTSVLPPLTPSGGKDASVWARAGARDIKFLRQMQA